MSNTEQRPYVPAKTIPSEFPVRSSPHSASGTKLTTRQAHRLGSVGALRLLPLTATILMMADTSKESLDMREDLIMLVEPSQLRRAQA